MKYFLVVVFIKIQQVNGSDPINPSEFTYLAISHLEADTSIAL